jgi:starch-binding outer membrane protein, SusD/RagB family
MNKIYIFFCLAATVLASCNKVLDTTPEGVITDANFWTSSDNLKLYANNFYPSLYVPDQNADNQSDNCVTSSPNNWLYGFATIPNSGGGWATGDWANIRNANYFLTHYQTVTGDAADINHYVGEIRFFRANEYFSKVRTFGDVPWINKDLMTSDTAYLYRPRDPQQLIIDSVISDLTFAIANLKAPENLELGRLHKYAAMQLLARVALYQATYMKYRGTQGWQTYMNLAANTASQIMATGKYEIVKPGQTYYFRKDDLIDATTNTKAAKDYPLYYREEFIQEDLTKNKECILPRVYQAGLLAHYMSRSVYESGVGVSKDLVEDFLCADGLPITESPLYKGDDSIIVEMENRDPRLRNMIANRFLPYYLNGTMPLAQYLILINKNNLTGYMAAKFRSPIPAQNEANQTTYDRFVFRYAEVLLIYAEAKAELGTITQSDLDNTINLLRARLSEPDMPAGMMGKLTLNPVADPNAVTITGQPRYGYALSPLLYEIRRERRIELAFEGFRWDDIVRWKAGKLVENPKTEYGMVVNNDVQTQYNNYFGYNVFQGISTVTIQDWDGTKQLVNPYPGTSLRVWNDKLYRSPVPLEQINLSGGVLKQTTGW